MLLFILVLALSSHVRLLHLLVVDLEFNANGMLTTYIYYLSIIKGILSIARVFKIRVFQISGILVSYGVTLGKV